MAKMGWVVARALVVAFIGLGFGISACGGDDDGGGGSSGGISKPGGSCSSSDGCECWKCTCSNGSTSNVRACINNKCPAGMDTCACFGGATVTSAEAVDAAECGP